MLPAPLDNLLPDRTARLDVEARRTLAQARHLAAHLQHGVQHFGLDVLHGQSAKISSHASPIQPQLAGHLWMRDPHCLRGHAYIRGPLGGGGERAVEHMHLDQPTPRQQPQLLRSAGQLELFRRPIEQFDERQIRRAGADAEPGHRGKRDSSAALAQAACAHRAGEALNDQLAAIEARLGCGYADWPWQVLDRTFRPDCIELGERVQFRECAAERDGAAGRPRQLAQHVELRAFARRELPFGERQHLTQIGLPSASNRDPHLRCGEVELDPAVVDGAIARGACTASAVSLPCAKTRLPVRSRIRSSGCVNAIATPATVPRAVIACCHRPI